MNTSENLSINFHKKTLLITALNGSLPAAAQKAGISLEEARAIILADNCDSLNVELNTKNLILKALNSTETKMEAARELGISERGLHRHIKNFNITFEKQAGKKIFYISDTKKING